MNENTKINDSITHLVMKSVGKLDVFLADILTLKGGKSTLPKSIELFDIHNFQGFCGYNYWYNGELIAQLHLATLEASGFVLYRKIFGANESHRYDYYNEQGDFIYSSDTIDGQTISYQSINMETNCPFTNHLYNVLTHEYDSVSTGMARTKLVYFIEELLRAIYNNHELPLSARDEAKDFALRNILNEINKTEIDPVLKWSERQEIYKHLKQVRKKIIHTKCRVHRFNIISYSLKVFAQDLFTRFSLLKKRPGDNIRGFLYQMTIGNLLWFIGTVRSNLGYSIALAIYGPFTFYFITQPMNPHAMWAVGKVRNAYIKATNSLETSLFNNTQVVDKVQIQQASLTKTIKEKRLPEMPVVDWQTRMGDFKAMQIAHEANMVFAERMGRIEQMESQFSFPLTTESAWFEIERYISQINADLNFFKNLDSNYKNFLKKEKKRAIDNQIYIWRKMAQFFRDYPYIIVDQDSKQTQKDYYIGRAFIFMQEMTNKLSKIAPSQAPSNHKMIRDLAEFYANNKQQGQNILDNLKRNSKLFAQNDTFSSDELRSYMKRHWEILFIQQNKKQEASSFGLQAYTWSIKNAIWLLQSVYSVKRDDLRTLTYKYNLDNQNTANIKSDITIDLQYEHLFHLLKFEYVSLKKEFSQNLRGDTESFEREKIINELKDFLKEREQFFNKDLQVANNAQKDKRI